MKLDGTFDFALIYFGIQVDLKTTRDGLIFFYIELHVLKGFYNLNIFKIQLFWAVF